MPTTCRCLSGSDGPASGSDLPHAVRTATIRHRFRKPPQACARLRATNRLSGSASSAAGCALVDRRRAHRGPGDRGRVLGNQIGWIDPRASNEDGEALSPWELSENDGVLAWEARFPARCVKEFEYEHFLRAGARRSGVGYGTAPTPIPWQPGQSLFFQYCRIEALAYSFVAIKPDAIYSLFVKG